MKLAVRSGLTIDQYWDLTPNEIALHIEAYNDSVLEDYRRELYGAWHVVAFKRSKKLPSLKELLEKLDSKEKTETKKEINYQKIERVAREKGLKLPKSFVEERRLKDV